MECPSCGEKRIKWADKDWKSDSPDFWTEDITVAFVCRGKFKFTKDGVVQITKCKKVKNEEA